MKHVKDKIPSPEAAALRHSAEELLQAREAEESRHPLTADATLRLIHELEVHQIELEMQNAELCQARMDLEKALMEYADLYDFAPAGYFTLDRKQTIKDLNLSGAKLLGRDRSYLIGRHFGEFIAAADRPAFTAFFREVFSDQGRKIREMELPCEGALPISVQFEATADAAGDVCRVVLNDISVRKHALVSLQQSEEKYRAMIEAFDGLMYICSKEFRIEYMNGNFIRRTGHDATGELCYAALHDRDSVCEWCVNNQVLAGKTIRWEIQSPKDGRWYESFNLPIHNANGTISKQSMITDITERKNADEELRRKNAELEQFIYTTSHDLRTPLVTIKTFLGFLANDMAGNNRERIGQDMQVMHGAADKMKLLLDELLEMSRIDRIQTPPVSVSLLEVLNEVVAAMAGVISEKAVEIRMPESDLILLAERTRLCQIWQNLIENAIKYSRHDTAPVIEINIRQSDIETVFSIRDNGIGIDPHYYSKVFGIFEKLDPKSSGAGLGLSMIRRIIEKYEGRIWVESEGIDKGACFFFTLPTAVIQTT